MKSLRSGRPAQTRGQSAKIAGGERFPCAFGTRLRERRSSCSHWLPLPLRQIPAPPNTRPEDLCYSLHRAGICCRFIVTLFMVNSLRAEVAMFRRFLLIAPGVALIAWISSLFHGVGAFLIFLLLWFELRRICRALFVRPFFHVPRNVQTLGLSSYRSL